MILAGGLTSTSSCIFFCMGVGLDLGWAGLVGQARRSQVKFSKSCCDIMFSCLLPGFEVKVKGRSQGQMSGA